ncbi:MAG TPA: RNA repair transcriptional activator RtcR [Blastocatellia bacterium]|nr:RNA repair transcriptional activator RtcR [Blastocatellia bacterium]
MAREIVIIGMLGPTVDGGDGPERWDRWRPTVAVCQQEDLIVKRFEMLYQKRYERLARTVIDDIGSISPETTVRSTRLEFNDPWDLEEVYGALHDFARNQKFDTAREEYLVHITTGTHVQQICLFLLTEARYFPGKLIQTAMAPGRERGETAGWYRIIDLDLSKYDRIASRFRKEREHGVSFLKSGIATRSRAFNQLIDRIEEVAIRSRDPLLLMGPTGAGKSRLAKRIYELKRARHLATGDFIEVNCATVRGDAAMSTLFGHVKGAFTGALKDRPGLLRAANNGVLFLDEIGEMGIDEQTMLLRALEEKTFFPLGGDREVKSDFQLIAGTNRDLQVMVGEGGFREDLLARINLWTFRLPGLRERAEDIEPNLEYELGEYARRNGALVTFSREARARFLKFAVSSEARWQGNFRDLNGAVTRMATLAPGGRISTQVVEEEIERLSSAWTAPKSPVTCDGDQFLQGLLSAEELEKIDLFDRLQLAAVIKVCRECRTLSEAGRELFGSSRARKTTSNDADRLRKYLARFGLSWDSVRGEDRR